MGKSTPPGWHSVTPRLVVKDPAAPVEFLKKTFHARGEFSAGAPAQMRIGDSIVMVSGVGPRDPMPAFLYVYVDDVDAAYRRAMVKDSWGNDWQIATHKNGNL